MIPSEYGMYGPLPERMRLIILPISIFGAIGTPGQAFISELSRRVGGSVPPSLLPHASWATPRVGPMIRMALTHAVRRGLAASIHTHWRRENLVAGGEGDEAVPPAPLPPLLAALPLRPRHAHRHLSVAGDRLGNPFINAKDSGKARRHNAVLACWRAGPPPSVPPPPPPSSKATRAMVSTMAPRQPRPSSAMPTSTPATSPTSPGSPPPPPAPTSSLRSKATPVHPLPLQLQRLATAHGSTGGAPSTSEGHHLAFGNTEEALLRTILGTRQRGQPSEPPP